MLGLRRLVNGSAWTDRFSPNHWGDCASPATVYRAFNDMPNRTDVVDVSTAESVQTATVPGPRPG